MGSETPVLQKYIINPLYGILIGVVSSSVVAYGPSSVGNFFSDLVLWLGIFLTGVVVGSSVIIVLISVLISGTVPSLSKGIFAAIFGIGGAISVRRFASAIAYQSQSTFGYKIVTPPVWPFIAVVVGGSMGGLLAILILQNSRFTL